LLLLTVTRSDTGAGVVPDEAVPKLIAGCSSASERLFWMSMSTLAEPVVPPEDPPPAQLVAGDEVLRGVGVSAEKSSAFEPVSAQPASARIAAVELLRAAATAAPS